MPEPVARASTTTSTTAPAEVTVRGMVAGVFVSARVVQLIQPVNGVSNVALTPETEIVRANGARATLADVTAASMIEAVGRSSTGDTVVARRLTLL